MKANSGLKCYQTPAISMRRELILEKLDTAKIKAILFDLGDTLIHGNFTAGQTESVWEEIYKQLINPQADPAIPTLPQIRSAWQTHVQSAMARVWQEKIEQELEFLPMIQRAFEAAGLARASDPI